jgi:hypothetical protein
MNNTVLVAIASYAGGLISGYILARFIDKKAISDKGNGDIVLLAVTIMWVISMAVELTTPVYKTSPLVHGLMGAIVGFFYRPGKKLE